MIGGCCGGLELVCIFSRVKSYVRLGCDRW